MSDCIFCNIANGAIPTKLIYENDTVIAFDDLNPQAPHHILIIPRKHIATLNDLPEDDKCPMNQMTKAATKIAKKLKIHNSGYRFVINCNKGAGQTVFHIHAHLLGGRQMNWPPG